MIVGGRGGLGRQRGFTLLELMIVVTILGIIASVGVPQYVSALRIARIGKAKHELVTISHLIDAYAANHGGNLPLTLHQVGFGGRRDPWGLPYCYLNYADGTGDGLAWAVAAGIVDPSAFQASSSGGGGAVPRRIGALGRRPAVLGPQEIAVAVDTDYQSARVKATAIAETLEREVSASEVEALATAIVSSGTFSMYVEVAAETTRRRDRYMFPLNTDYDLFSLGPDMRTAVSLGETVGLDDVIRANNGGFFGTAADY